MNIHPEVVRKDGKARLGRGFSRGELKEAEVDFKQALRLAVPVDLRRKTKHEENVHILKQYLSLRMPKISKPPKPSKKPLKKPSKPMKAEVMEQKPAKPTKPTKQKKTTEIRKPSKRAKAPKAERTTSKKSPAKRKIVKSKGKEKT